MVEDGWSHPHHHEVFYWTLTDIIHMGKEDEQMKVPAALSKLDTSRILFFLGILMSISQDIVTTNIG